MIWTKQGSSDDPPSSGVDNITFFTVFPPGWLRIADSSGAPAGLWLVGLLEIPTHLHPLLMEGLGAQSIKIGRTN